MRHLIALAVSLAACGDNIDGITVDDYEAAIAAAACTRSIACGTIASRAECELPNVFAYELDARFVDAVHDGRIAWNPIAASECIEDWISRGCDWTSADYRTRDCPPLARGTLVEGETCLISSECISNECWNEGCTEACCAGTCVGSIAPTPAGIDEPCRTASCADGYCDGSVCRPFISEDGECDREGACAYGLACRGRRCVALPGTGEPCLPSHGVSECRELRDHCSTQTYRCEPRRGLGGVCAADHECNALYTCVQGQCVLQRAELGESCSYTYECATPGAICSFGDGCILPRAAGEPCSDFTECESNICNYTTGTCVSLEGCL